MRVISGTLKGRKIKGYTIEGTRATMDRIKESLFAMLQDSLMDTICLDLFAGTGSLGIEALSNGARECYFVDSNPLAVRTIKNNLKDFGILERSQVFHEDSFQFLKKNHQKFDLIFLDPPYHAGIYEKIIQTILDQDCLNQNALLIIESDKEVILEDACLQMYKNKKYGDKYIRIYQYIPRTKSDKTLQI